MGAPTAVMSALTGDITSSTAANTNEDEKIADALKQFVSAAIRNHLKVISTLCDIAVFATGMTKRRSSEFDVVG